MTPKPRPQKSPKRSKDRDKRDTRSEPKREDWDFSSCPDDQLKACYYYEFARECRHAREVSRRLNHHLAKVAHEHPAGAINPRSIALDIVDFFKNCPEFPGSPFLSIPKGERKRRLSLFRGVHVPVQADLSRLFREHARRGISSKTIKYPTSAGYDGEIAAFFVDWRNTNEDLARGFRAWLDRNRAAGIAGVYKKGKGSSQEQRRKYLKALGAWRLLKRMTWEDAYTYTREILRNKRGQPQALLGAHASTWKRGEKDAEKRIAALCAFFERLR